MTTPVYIAAPRGASLRSNIFAGLQSFTGTDTPGLQLKSLTDAQITALAAASALPDGSILISSTTNRAKIRLNGVTEEVITTQGGQTINGPLTVTGLVRSATGVICGSPTTLDAGKLFQVEGNFGTAGGQGIKLRNTNASGYTEMVFNNDNNRVDGCALVGFGGSTAVGTPNDLYLSSRVGGIQFYTNNSYRARFLFNGRFLINTSTDDGGSLLQVNGTAAVTTLALGGGTGPLLRNSGGTIEARNNANTAGAPISCTDLTASGTVTSPENIFTNGANSTRVARATGATGRIQIYRPNDPATVSVEFGGGNDEIRIRGGLGSFNHTGAQLQISSAGTMTLGCTGALTLVSNGSTAQTITGANTVFGGTITYSSINFPELVTNGGFDTDTAWTKGTGWTISGGTAVATGVVSFADIQQNLPSVVLGQTYVVTFTIGYTSGTLAVYLGSSGSSFGFVGQVNVAGTYSFLFHKNSFDAAKTILFRANSAFTGTIDNVSVKRAF